MPETLNSNDFTVALQNKTVKEVAQIARPVIESQLNQEDALKWKLIDKWFERLYPLLEPALKKKLNESNEKKEERALDYNEQKIPEIEIASIEALQELKKILLSTDKIDINLSLKTFLNDPQFDNLLKIPQIKLAIDGWIRKFIITK